jgi:large subunit ribosomal protein L32
MALQKKRRGPARTRQQRSAWMKKSGERSTPTVQSCPNCQAPKIPHRVCLQCGFYNGKQVTKAKASAAE